MISALLATLLILIVVVAGAFLLVWALRDDDSPGVTGRKYLVAGQSVYIDRDLYIEGRLIAFRGESVQLASRVLYRDHGYCWSGTTSNGRHIFPIPEMAIVVHQIVEL